MAGALGMSLAAFVGFDALAGAIWAGLFLGLGWIFADQIQQVTDMLSALGMTAVAVVAVAVAAYVALRWWRRRLFLKGVAMPRIDVAGLRALIDGGAEPVIIDVRSQAARAVDDRRIPQALAIGLAQIERAAKDLPRDRELVLYCNCPNEASAASAAGLLVRKGFSRARPLAGGLDAGVESGQRVEVFARPAAEDAVGAADAAR